MLKTGQALFLLESPRKAFGQMEAGRLKTTEFKTIIIYPRQIRAKTTSAAITMYVTNSAHPPSPHQANYRKMEKLPGGSGSCELANKLAACQRSLFFLGIIHGEECKEHNTNEQSRAGECYQHDTLYVISHKVAAHTLLSHANLHVH